MTRKNDHLPLTDVRERRLREDSGPDGATAFGYDAGNGQIAALRGDRDFPYIMVPPDLGEAALYALHGEVAITGNEGKDTSDYAVGNTVDVRGFRHLTFYLTFTLPSLAEDPDDPNNALSILPQVANSGVPPILSSTVYRGTDAPPSVPGTSLQWHGIAVVDPVIRGAMPTVALPATALLAPHYGFRNVHMTQLELPYAPRGGDAEVGIVEYHTMLVFDVTAYEYFRLCWARTFVAGRETAVYPDSNGTQQTPVFRLHIQAQR